MTRVVDKELLTQHQNFAMMHSICAMQDFRHKSTEELRLEAYGRVCVSGGVKSTFGLTAAGHNSQSIFSTKSAAAFSSNTIVGGSPFSMHTANVSPSSAIFQSGQIFNHGSSLGALSASSGTPGTHHGAAFSYGSGVSNSGALSSFGTQASLRAGVPGSSILHSIDGQFSDRCPPISAFGRQTNVPFGSTSAFGYGVDSLQQTRFQGSGTSLQATTIPQVTQQHSAHTQSNNQLRSSSAFGMNILGPELGSRPGTFGFSHTSGAFAVDLNSRNAAHGVLASHCVVNHDPAFTSSTLPTANTTNHPVVLESHVTKSQSSFLDISSSPQQQRTASIQAHGFPAHGTFPTHGTHNRYNTPASGVLNNHMAGTSNLPGVANPSISIFGSRTTGLNSALSPSKLSLSTTSSFPGTLISSSSTLGIVSRNNGTLYPFQASTAPGIFVSTSPALTTGVGLSSTTLSPSAPLSSANASLAHDPLMTSGSTSLTPLKNNTALPGINYHFGQSRTTTCDPQVSNGAAMHKVQETLHVNTLPYGRILASPRLSEHELVQRAQTFLSKDLSSNKNMSLPMRHSASRPTKSNWPRPRSNTQGKFGFMTSAEQPIQKCGPAFFDTGRVASFDCSTTKKWILKPRESPRNLYIRPEVQRSKGGVSAGNDATYANKVSNVGLLVRSSLSSSARGDLNSIARHSSRDTVPHAEKSSSDSQKKYDDTSDMRVLPFTASCDSYDIEPSMDTLQSLWKEEGEDALSSVDGFTITRKNVGSIKWLEPVDVRHLCIDRTVRIDRGVVHIHHQCSGEVEQRLRKRAEITLHGCMPKKPGKVARVKFEKRILRQTEEMGATLLDHNLDSGVWRFALNL